MNSIVRNIQIALEHGLDNRAEAAALLRDAQDEIVRLENLAPKMPRLYRLRSAPDIVVLKKGDSLVVVWTKNSLDYPDPYPTTVPAAIFETEELTEIGVRNILELRKSRCFKDIRE